LFVSILLLAVIQPEVLLAQGAGALGPLTGLLPLVVIFAIFYLILIRPQQKRQKDWAAKLATLKNGDRVITSGGLKGTIITVKDDSFYLRVPPDNLRVEVVKSSVVSVSVEEEKS
jgi:preprotein translocase subunit YajC